MSYLRLGMFALLLSFATDSLARTCCDFDLKENQHHWYAALGIGDSIDYRAGAGGYLMTLPPIPQPLPLILSPQYNSSPIYFQGEVGYTWKNPFAFDPDSRFFPFMGLGIQYRYTDQVSLDTPTNFFGIATRTVPYRLEESSALLNWKIDFYQWFNRLMPYLNLGLGTSWARTSQTLPIPANPNNPTGTLVTTDSQTTTNWSYNIGAGFDFIVVTNFWLSLGYSYDNFGQLQLGSLNANPEILSGSNPLFRPADIGNLHAHNIIFTARYLFG
ncbi:hypothetical protein A1D18_02485 [Candidatus Rickettsiella isopodorum]|jgi:opacity protein-like surface antigen|uniref:Outer membrane protein beta-barrel domain-containing protein n=1 Tax=Candidatus Rickettsiella isopodorum TaxID=1225476 RepID=A0A1J8PCB0_9COXI|nr:outer membrane beta-barrel protein [Candidatus Rickettsiella isopodorum]OIZ94991.1 hypothetical protein A1D18_02485 [Candidatus Rickettsiella isopodorum]